MFNTILNQQKWLLLLMCCSFVSQAAFEPFKKSLDKIPTAQDKLAFVLEQQATAQTWPLEDLGRFYHQKGLVQEANDQIEAAKAAFTESINTFVELDQPNEYWVQSLQDRSYMDYLLTNDVNVYCADREMAVDVARKTESPKAKTESIVFFAFCFQEGFEAFKQGLSLLEEAAAVAKENNLAADATAMIHNATGNLYRTNQVSDMAYEYYEKAYDHWAQLKDIQDMFNMQHNLAGQSVALGHWEVAEKHIKILFDLAESNPDFSDFTFFSYYNRAILEFSKNSFATAIDAIESALELAHTTSEKYFVKGLQGFQVVAYFRNNQIKQAGDLAADFLTDTELNLKQEDLNKQVRLIYDFSNGDYIESVNTLWQLLDENKKSKSSFIKNSVALQSITFDQTISQFQEKALANKLTISELELERRTKQNKINQLTLLAAVLLTLVLIAVSFYLFKSRQFYLRSSRTDFLTRSDNRRRVFELGEKQLAQAKHQQQPLSVAVLDIDDFKTINDRLGHDFGDHVLIHLVNTVKKRLSKNQTIGRVGGEEFLLLFPESEPLEAKEIAEEIRKYLSTSSVHHRDSTLNYSISIGVFGTSDYNISFEQMTKQADLALYEAKKSGKNTVVLKT